MGAAWTGCLEFPKKRGNDSVKSASRTLPWAVVEITNRSRIGSDITLRLEVVTLRDVVTRIADSIFPHGEWKDQSAKFVSVYGRQPRSFRASFR